MGMRSVADAVAGEGENMRIFRLAVIVGGFGLALAGCTSTSGGTAGGSPSPTAPTGVASSSGGAVPACLVGTWKATGMDRTDNVAGAEIKSSGGGGFTLTISPDGSATVDFTGMQPITFASKAGNTEIKGQYSHGGKVMSALKATPTSDTAGTFEPTGTVDWNVAAVSEVGVALSALMTLPPWEYWPLISVLPALLAKVIGCIPVKSTVAEPSGLIVRVKPPPPELLISAPATLSVRSMPVAFQVPTRHAGTAPPLELATPVGAVGLGLPPAVPPLVDVHPASARPKPPTITASRKMRMFSPSPATASATDLIPIDQAGQPANRLTCPAAEDREAPALEEAVHVKETRGT